MARIPGFDQLEFTGRLEKPLHGTNIWVITGCIGRSWSIAYFRSMPIANAGIN
jgi:hypothetical protein